ncbi:MAG TPA: helix-turn-helix domain-containing protein [Candidatus Sumerlaeota bacterium]|nr:helix-turn-helix domain-containing protein [Candidatus Sumerlaeota bacterium]HPS01927.1 helix-turn-helix domain-containing protein [Candidatus Sumerlaeota bacterium]
MRKLQIQDAEIMKAALQQEIVRSDESRYDNRLHGVLLVCSGKSCYEVAQLLGHSPRTIEYWVERFEQSGFAGLEEGERPGRPACLDAAKRQQIAQDLRQSPRELGYDQNLWDGKMLSHHLLVRFGVQLGVRQCQRLFGSLGFRLRKPRPVIAQSDPASQQAYKKTTPSGAKKGH